MAKQLEILLLIAGVGLLYLCSPSTACNEALCASLVSKCMLLKSCECNLMDTKNCTCCKDCHRCLAKLYTECCDCVGMCPARNPKDNYMRTSSVEEIKEPIPELFQILTEEEDEQQRWMVYTYPAHHDLLYFKPRNNMQDINVASTDDSTQSHRVRHFGNHHVTIDPQSEAMNCTVAYFSQCMSLHKCKQSCQSMGAARYRWFHQFGCCECIGSTCLDYGKGEALCLKCPLPDGVQDDEDEDEFYYDNDDRYLYGEDDDDDDDAEGEEEDEDDSTGGVRRPDKKDGTREDQGQRGQAGSQRQSRSRQDKNRVSKKIPLSGEEEQNLGDDPNKLSEYLKEKFD